MKEKRQNVYLNAIAMSFNLIILLFLSLLQRNVEGSIEQCGEPTLPHPDIKSNDFNVDIKQQPWMASLGKYTSHGWEHQCGGSLITHTHVLTAAHCFGNLIYPKFDPEKSNYTMRLGEADLKKETTLGTERKIQHILVHPKYLSEKAYFDVGLAIADKPIEFNEYIRPICLPLKPVDDVDYLEGDLVTLAGWGLFYNLKNEIQIETLLKLINLRVLPKHECDKQFSPEAISKAGLPVFQVRKQLPYGFKKDISCVGNPFKVENACEGDSGSPVVRVFEGTARGNPYYEQHFIVSTGIDCRLPATIYVRVTDREILTWLQNVTDSTPLLMVVGGSNSEGLLDDVELISPTPNDECSNAVARISDGTGIDARAEGLTGQFTKNAPIVCGGRRGDETLNSCYEYHPVTNSWSIIPSTIQFRYQSSSVLDKNENIWILGGGTKDPRAFDSTEYYQYRPDGRGSWKKGIPLPPELRDTGITSHCAVRINSTHTFLAGGYVVIREAEDPLTNRIKPGSQDISAAGAVPRSGSQATATPVPKDDGTDLRILNKRDDDLNHLQFQRAWMFDGFYWQEIEDMFETRDRAACSLFQLPTGDIRILVAGGCNGWCGDNQSEALSSAEVYNPDVDEWTLVAPLPVPLHSAKLELLGGLPTIIGGWNAQDQTDNDVLYQYHSETGEWIAHPSAKMRIARKSAAVFQVPRSLAKTC